MSATATLRTHKYCPGSRCLRFRPLADFSPVAGRQGPRGGHHGYCRGCAHDPHPCLPEPAACKLCRDPALPGYALCGACTAATLRTLWAGLVLGALVPGVDFPTDGASPRRRRRQAGR